MIKKTILIGSYLIMSTTLLYGQGRLLRYADQEFGLQRYEHAGSQYELAYSKKPKYSTAKRAAESYSRIKSYKESHEWWGKVISHPEAEKQDYVNYVLSAKHLGKEISGVKLPLSNEELTGILRNWEAAQRSGFEWEGLSTVNGKGSDYGYRKNSQGVSYFVSDNGTRIGTEKKALRLDVRNRVPNTDRYDMNERGYHKIYKVKGSDVSAVKIDLKGIYHVSMPSFFVREGKEEVIFTGVLDQGKRRKRGTYEVFPGLYRGKVDSNGDFKDVEPLPFNQPLLYGLMHGFVSGDYLYFSSNNPGGFGGYDLYRVELQGESYGSPENLGSKVNSSSNDVFPYVYENNLYFSSDRVGGMGGLDLYKTSMNGWNVENMGASYNSVQDDFGYYVDGQGVAYLSSDRGMEESLDDIYRLKYLYDRYKFVVKNEEGRLPFGEGLTFRVLESSGKEMEISNPSEYTRLDEGTYRIEVSKSGYFPRVETLKSTSPSGKDMEIELSLLKIPYGKVVSLDTVYYDLDKFTMRADGAEVLNRAATLLKQYPEFELLISSHTDARASNTYNERLSEKRSKSAKEYLEKQGIAASRIQIEWKGEEKLLTPCGNNVDCPEEQHQKNRRSELNLILYPVQDFDYLLPIELRSIDNIQQLIQTIIFR